MTGACVLVPPGGPGKGGGAGAPAALSQVLDHPLPGPDVRPGVVAVGEDSLGLVAVGDTPARLVVA